MGGLAAPLAAVLLAPIKVVVDPDVPDALFFTSFAADPRGVADELESAARMDSFEALAVMGVLFSLATLLLPRPRAARI